MDWCSLDKLYGCTRLPPPRRRWSTSRASGSSTHENDAATDDAEDEVQDEEADGGGNTGDGEENDAGHLKHLKEILVSKISSATYLAE